MTILAAAILDFIQHLKMQGKDWIYEPLVVTDNDKLKHCQFVTIKKRPNNNISAIQFYSDNPPIGTSTLIKAKKKDHRPRIIEFRLDGTTAKLHLRYWRANGWLQTNKAEDGRTNPPFYVDGSPPPPLPNHVRHPGNLPASHPVQQDGEMSYQVYRMERITRRKKKKAFSILHRDIIDLAHPDSAMTVARLTVLTLDKSLKKTYGAGNGEPKQVQWHNNMAVVTNGRNFLYEDNMLRAEIVYG